MISKKILASIVVIGLLAFAMGWGTYSYFSDTETSTGNTFQAGTLDLEIGGWNTPTKITVSNLAPGDSGSSKIAVKNVGTIDGALNLELAAAENHEGNNPESETGDTAEPGELGNYLVVTIYFDDDGNLSTVGDQTFVCYGVINDIGGKLYYAYHPLCAGDLSYLVVVWSLPGGTGNDVQGDIVSFDIKVVLEQATIVKSAVLNYGPGGWGGWSDKEASKHGSVRNCIVKNKGTGEGDYALKIWWGPGASTDGVNYPNTPWGGYTYDQSIPETGYLVRNDNDNDVLQLVLVYPP